MPALVQNAEGFWVPADDAAITSGVSGCGPSQIGRVWRGQRRPKRARSVPAYSRVPSDADMVRLSALGYPATAVLCRPYVPVVYILRTDDDGEPLHPDDFVNEFAVAFVHPEHPYVPGAPTRRSTEGGGYNRAKVLDELGKMRLGDAMAAAIFDVVITGKAVPTVADARQLRPRTLEKSVNRFHMRYRRRGDVAVAL